MAESNTAIELHDSDVVRVEQRGDGLVVMMTAYLHRSDGVPGVDAGSGWRQTVEVLFRRGRIARGGNIVLPLTISEGFFEFGNRKIENCLPVPIVGADLTALEIVGATAEILRVEGEDGEISMVDEPTFVEKYPGS